MLAKVIAWGPDRPAALRRLDAALAATTVLGVTTNIAFLRALLADPDVLAGRLDTGLVERHRGRARTVPAQHGTGQHGAAAAGAEVGPRTRCSPRPPWTARSTGSTAGRSRAVADPGRLAARRQPALDPLAGRRPREVAVRGRPARRPRSPSATATRCPPWPRSGR